MSFSFRWLLTVLLFIQIQGTEFKANESGAAKSDARSEPAAEAADQFSGQNYLVVSWKRTELQEAFSSAGDAKENSKAYVMIDGNSLYTPAGKFDPELMNWNQLAEQLRPFSDRKKGIVEFSVYNFAGNAREHSFLGWTLDGFARQKAGFATAYVSQTFSGPGDFWELVNAGNKKMSGRIEGDELPVGNDIVKVYPVQTFISCIKSGNADCVVRILPTISKNTGEMLAPEIRKAILEHVPKVATDQKGTLLFLVSYTAEAKQTIEWFRMQGADEFARSLSFEKAVVKSAEY